MNSYQLKASSVFIFLVLSLLAIAVLAVTLPTLATNTKAPAPLGRLPLPTPTVARDILASPTPPSVATAPAAGSPTAAAATVSQLLPVGQTGPWRLVFQDEFAGSSLDRSTWTTCYPWFEPTKGCTNVGNEELQWYLPQSVVVENGSMTLSADEHRYTGTDGKTYPYTSGMISSGAGPYTGPGFAFQYGYAEARLKIPAGRGLFPAFWMAPADGSWPPEIDVAERVGSTSPNKLEMVVHYALPEGGHDFNSTHFVGPDFSSEWHVFGVEWTPSTLVWYIDGVERKRYTRVENIPRKPMYLMFSMAIRGDPAPDESVPLPTKLEVDYVRVWQR